MSLTGLLRAPDVRARFNEEFRKPKLALSSDSFVGPTEPSGAHARLVGTAFDYVFRLHVTLVNAESDRVWEPGWIADVAVDLLARRLALGRSVFAPGHTGGTRGLLARARRTVRPARAEYERCCESGGISAAMLEHALLLAQLEQFYRCGLLSPRFGDISRPAIADLRNLVRLAQRLAPATFLASHVCVLNPGFRSASALVGGADADLLIDDTLIEVKVVKHLKFTAEMFRQLVGYFTLYTLRGGVSAGPRPKPEIRHVAVYFARQAVLHRFAIDSVVNARTFPAFARWFKRRAMNGPPPQSVQWSDGTTLQF